MKTKLTNCVKTVLLSFMLGVLFACCQGAALPAMQEKMLPG